MIDRIKGNNSWLILVLGTLTFFIVALNRQCMPVLFSEISDNLGLSTVEVGTIWGMDPFAGVFVSLLAGITIDRLGIKRVLTVTCISIGIFGALRGFSANFASMAVTMFVFGLFAASVPTLVVKTLSMYFDKSKLGRANGFALTGATIGSMFSISISATIMSPLLDGWENVLFLYGVPAVILGLAWFITTRESNNSGDLVTGMEIAPFRQTYLHIIKNKQIWITGLIMMACAGSQISVMGYLPLYLREAGWSTVSADIALMIIPGLMAIVAIPTGFLSDKLGSRKKVLVPIIAVSSICIGLIPIASDIAVWLIIPIYAMTRGGVVALLFTMVIETKGVRGIYAGTATGIAMSIQMLGAAIFPSLGNSLSVFNSGLPFVLWAGISAISLLLFVYVKENK